MEHHVALAGEPRGEYRSTDRRCGTLEQAGKHGILERPDSVARTLRGFDSAGGVDGLQRPNIPRIMKCRELIDRCRPRRVERVVGQPAEHPDEIQHGGMTHDLQGVVIAESGAPEHIAAHVEWRQLWRSECGRVRARIVRRRASGRIVRLQ